MANIENTEWSKLPKILHKELEVRRKHREFKDLRKLEKILQILRAMIQKELLPDLSSLLKCEIPDLENEIEGILDPYFIQFSNAKDLLRDFKKYSYNYCSMKKVYQLSHAIGVCKTKIYNQKNLEADIVNVFLGDSFIKAYESLPIVLAPITRHFPDIKELKGKAKNKSQHYACLEKRFPKSTFSKEKISSTYNNLRNDLAHSEALIEDGLMRKIGSGMSSSKPIQITTRRMQIMQLLTILYATEIDIRILGLALRKEHDFYEAWMEYFEIYVKWFLKIDKDLKSTN